MSLCDESSESGPRGQPSAAPARPSRPPGAPGYAEGFSCRRNRWTPCSHPPRHLLTEGYVPAPARSPSQSPLFFPTAGLKLRPSSCGRARNARWEVSRGPGLHPLVVSPNPSQDNPKGLQMMPHAPGDVSCCGLEAVLTQQPPTSEHPAVSGTLSLRAMCSQHPELSPVFMV